MRQLSWHQVTQAMKNEGLQWQQLSVWQDRHQHQEVLYVSGSAKLRNASVISCA